SERLLASERTGPRAASGPTLKAGSHLPTRARRSRGRVAEGHVWLCRQPFPPPPGAMPSPHGDIPSAPTGPYASLLQADTVWLTCSGNIVAAIIWIARGQVQRRSRAA